MNMKTVSLGIVLASVFGVVQAQELFVVSQPQANKENQCQENCAQDTQAQAPLQIDRSGMDKASVHLQIMQQTSPRFSEPAGGSKKSGSDDKKSTSTKTQENSWSRKAI